MLFEIYYNTLNFNNCIDIVFQYILYCVLITEAKTISCT